MDENIATTATNQEPVTATETDATLAGTAGEEESTLIDSAIEGSQEKADTGEKKEEAKELPPEKYEIKVPEGMTLDSDTLDMFTPIFKELGITQEGAQKLVDAYVPLIQSTTEKTRKESMSAYKQLVDGWKSETMKELGVGSEKELSYCGKAIQKFGNNELREILNETGLGNHKSLVSFMAKVGKTISEDTFVDSGKPMQVDPEKALYPTMFK